jgi:hypothetical protein
LTCAIAARVLHHERPLELELASRIGRRDYFLQVGLNATWRVPIRKAKLNLDVFSFRTMLVRPLLIA